MHMSLSFDAFLSLPYTTGIVQNINEKATVEIRTGSMDNIGLILRPGEKYKFHDSSIFARSLWKDGEHVKIAVAQLSDDGSGGGGGSGDGGGSGCGDEHIATDEEVDEMLDGIIGDVTSEAAASAGTDDSGD